MEHAELINMDAPTTACRHAYPDLAAAQLIVATMIYRGYELAVSVLFLLISLIGMAVCCAGVSEIPKCKYGDTECYFFYKMCSHSYFNKYSIVANQGAPYTCAWVAKYRAVEGSSKDGLDQLMLPIIASIFSLIPGITLVISTVIRNERSILALLEAGKAFIIFCAVLHILSCVQIYQLTFDCRWYEDNLHGNQDACAAGYTKFVAGACIGLVCEFVLLAGIIAFGEIERRRVRSDVVESFKGGMGGFGD